ncbi:MAG: precorrin-6A reductase [Firmicutes bacterium HGW-Firmicutes-14]|nr:MAG: precorrin-6A reductase [Firmicutes bacterium HGW-Firmicutes-14]
MILVLGGTLEGREIANDLAARGYSVLLTVVSGYGVEMVPREAPFEVLAGELDAGALERLITEKSIKLIVDATHPYAARITEIAWETAGRKGIRYIRYDRPPVAGESAGITESGGKTECGSMAFRAGSYGEAAELAVTLGDTVFLTIGSRNLEPFVRAGKVSGKRIVARVLPDAKVLEQCSVLGFPPRDIIAVQGPFSMELNLAMLKEYGADVLVTKDSGSVGGTDKKLAAAARLGIPVVIVARPDYSGIPVTGKIREVLRQAGETDKK